VTHQVEVPGSSARRGGERVAGRASGGPRRSGAASPGRSSLVARWRAEAEILRRRGAGVQADLLACCADELAALDGASGAPDPTHAPPAAELLTVAEAARLLHTSVKWLYRRADTLPFTRRLSPHVVRFDAAALARWVARRA